LNDFFKEGDYKFTVIIEPSCTFPDGNTRNGSANVKKIYSCKNPKKLLSVVIGGKNNFQSRSLFGILSELLFFN